MRIEPQATAMCGLRQHINSTNQHAETILWAQAVIQCNLQGKVECIARNQCIPQRSRYA
jgi:hypothetical protein